MVARYLRATALRHLSALLWLSLGSFLLAASLGLNAILTRELVKTNDERAILGTAFWLRLTSSTFTAVLAITLVSAIRPGDDQLFIYVLLLATAGIFGGLQVFEFWFTAHYLSRISAIAQMLVASVGALARLLVIFAGAGLTAFVLITASETVLLGILLVLFFLARRKYPFFLYVRTSMAARLLRSSWPLMLSAAAASINLKIDRVMPAEVTDMASVGIYSAASVVSEVWYVLPTAVATAAFPALLTARETNLVLLSQPGSIDARHLCLGRTLDRNRHYHLFKTNHCSAVWGELPLGCPSPCHPRVGCCFHLHASCTQQMDHRRRTRKGVRDPPAHSEQQRTSDLDPTPIPRFGLQGAAVATFLSYAIASYFSLFLLPSTRPFARQMTAALTAPLRWVGR